MARTILTLCAVATLIAAGSPLTAQAVPVQPGTTWLLFVDDLHLDFRNTGRIRDLLRTIGRELIQEGDTFAVVSSGPSSLAVDLTSDRALLDSAIKKVTGNGLKPSDIIQADPRGPSEVRYRANIALTTAQELIRPLAFAPGQPKGMIYVSNGYDVDTSPEAIAAPIGASAGARMPNVSVADVRDQLTTLPQAASRAGVSIFAIDPRGVVAGAELDQMLDPVSWQKHLTTSRNHLRAISEQSGGFVIFELRDLIEGLKRIRSQMR